MVEPDDQYQKTLEITRILDENSSQPLNKEGWIRKKSCMFFSNWPYRYFILENKVLYCYVSASKEKFLGGINFDKISLHISTNEKKQEITLTPLSAKGNVRLRFLTAIDYKEWLSLLTIHINKSRGKKKALVDYPLWSLNRISIQEFKNIANSGDIILFCSKQIANSLQRVLSQSEYDHIGIVYKYPTGDIGFLESTKEDGVSICYWDDFLAYGWGLEYRKIGYRKLVAPDVSIISTKSYKIIKNRFFSSRLRKFQLKMMDSFAVNLQLKLIKKLD